MHGHKSQKKPKSAMNINVFPKCDALGFDNHDSSWIIIPIIFSLFLPPVILIFLFGSNHPLYKFWTEKWEDYIVLLRLKFCAANGISTGLWLFDNTQITGETKITHNFDGIY